jgi:uncharacterized phage protein (TIGR02216 family)
MTLRELTAAIEIRGLQRVAPPDRAAFDQLMRRFPDRSKDADRD